VSQHGIAPRAQTGQGRYERASELRIVACGVPHCPSGALASGATEVRDELPEYLGTCKQGYPRICCGYARLDELSSPVHIENCDCACDVSDGVIGP
jgi:hypothetical protein